MCCCCSCCWCCCWIVCAWCAGGWWFWLLIVTWWCCINDDVVVILISVLFGLIMFDGDMLGPAFCRFSVALNANRTILVDVHDFFFFCRRSNGHRTPTAISRESSSSKNYALNICIWAIFKKYGYLSYCSYNRLSFVQFCGEHHYCGGLDVFIVYTLYRRIHWLCLSIRSQDNDRIVTFLNSEIFSIT